MKTSIQIFAFIFIVFISISPAFSATWNGGGSDNLASTPANWTGNVLPPYGDIITFDATSSKDCTWDLNETYTCLTMESGYTGTVTLNSPLTLSSTYSSAGGVPVSGYPNWQERVTQVVTNAVRQAPQEYIANYTTFKNILLPASYPAVGPLYWNESLNQAARAHAVDMATTPCFQHDSCDGASWVARILSYYPDALIVGENIAWGTSYPKSVVDLWICESTNPASCAADGVGDGHRKNLMNAFAEEIGNGYYSSRWVQDLTRNTQAPQPPIVSGTHMIINSKLTFWLNYYDTGAPREVRIVINGSPATMTLAIGSYQSGLYTATVTTGSECESYHFEAVDSYGQGWRYPGTGEFQTYGINSCAKDYL